MGRDGREGRGGGGDVGARSRGEDGRRRRRRRRRRVTSDAVPASVRAPPRTHPRGLRGLFVVPVPLLRAERRPEPRRVQPRASGRAHVALRVAVGFSRVRQESVPTREVRGGAAALAPRRPGRAARALEPRDGELVRGPPARAEAPDPVGVAALRRHRVHRRRESVLRQVQHPVPDRRDVRVPLEGGAAPHRVERARDSRPRVLHAVPEHAHQRRGVAVGREHAEASGGERVRPRFERRRRVVAASPRRSARSASARTRRRRAA